MMEEKRTSSETSVGLSIGFPDQLIGFPVGASISLAHKRSQEQRVQRFWTTAIQQSGRSEEDILQEYSNGGQLADIVRGGFEQSAKDGNTEYQDFVGAFVVAALRDDAKIDTVSYVLTKLAELSAYHLRFIGRFPPYAIPTDAELHEIITAMYQNEANKVLGGPPPEYLSSMREVAVEAFSTPMRNQPKFRRGDADATSSALGCDTTVALALFSELQSMNLVTELGPGVSLTLRLPYDRVMDYHTGRHTWALSGLGLTMRGLIDQVMTEDGQWKPPN